MNRDIKSVRGARVRSYEGKTFSVRAQATVVCTGGIETARLLLLSDQLHASGAGNEHDNVGRYFMDHPWIAAAGYLRFSKPGVDWPLYFEQPRNDAVNFFGTIAPAPEFLIDKAVGGFRIVLQPSRHQAHGVESAHAIVDGLKKGEIAEDFGDHLFAMASNFDQLVDVAYKNIFKTRESLFQRTAQTDGDYVGAYLDLNLEQRPNRESRVFLEDERDAFGQRKIAVDWRLGQQEWRTAHMSMRAIAEEFGRLGLGRTRIYLSGDEDSDPEWPDTMSGSRHHIGATRMSSDPRDGVVDTNCRIHSIDNVYVASSSVFTTSGFANPTFTIIALALRLADHLKERYI